MPRTTLAFWRCSRSSGSGPRRHGDGRRPAAASIRSGLGKTDSARRIRPASGTPGSSIASSDVIGRLPAGSDGVPLLGAGTHASSWRLLLAVYSLAVVPPLVCRCNRSKNGLAFLSGHIATLVLVRGFCFATTSTSICGKRHLCHEETNGRRRDTILVRHDESARHTRTAFSQGFASDCVYLRLDLLDATIGRTDGLNLHAYRGPLPARPEPRIRPRLRTAGDARWARTRRRGRAPAPAQGDRA